MEALILAAGYATRLGSLTRERAKPLLPVGRKPLIDYIYDQLAAMPEVRRVSVVTNHRFASQFVDWAAGHAGPKALQIVDDDTTDDTNKLGAIGDIRLVLQRQHIDDDLLIAAGDNLFDCRLQGLVDFFHRRGTCVGLYDTGNLSIMTQYAVVELDALDRVVGFHEKPAQPASTLAATALYALSREHVALVEQYRQGGGNMDAPGYYIEWLYRQVPLYGYVLPGEWRDIGNLEQYRQAQLAYGGGEVANPAAG
ncbi:MAG TPA: nucleotidyltransferase family protein [Chloroflexota bacterium]|nr:nucleotidyltransferase family protein [Chloroflexota bacterium]